MLTASLLILMATLSSKDTFTNPVWERNFPDPFVLREGDTFYAYATHNGPRGFQLLSSQDLVAWKDEGPVGLPDWSNEQLWAPEVYRWKGKWYLFFSARNRETGKRDLAVSVGDGPKGPFRHLAKLIEGTSENPGGGDDGAIDPNLFVEDGQPYLLYIREARPRALKIVRLSPELDRTVGERKDLLLADREIERGVLDAPTLLKREGTYWLLYSSGWFQSWKRDACYRVYAAHSKSLMGPYVKGERPILDTAPGETYSPGHQCVIDLPGGEQWIAYHGWSAEGEPMYGHNPNGRTLRIDRLRWTPDGPRVDGPTVKPQPVPRVR